jgi:hypothetical protein
LVYGSLELDMSKRCLLFPILLFSCGLLSTPALSAETENQILSIGGLVQSPIQLTLDNLKQFRQEAISTVGHADSNGEKTVQYSAVPLKSLLELAKTQETGQRLVISVKNSFGEQLILSWGEIFLPARNRVFVAAATNAGNGGRRQDLPALILKRDNKAILALKQIIFIEVTTIAEFKSDPVLRRSAKMTHRLSFEVTHLENTI